MIRLILSKYVIRRLLTGAEHFTTLNLSYNENLSSISLRRLFEYEFAMKNLYLEGCTDILKYFEGTDENTWKLSERSNIKNVRLSIDRQINEIKYNALVNMWGDRYYERGKVVNAKCFLELTVK